MPASLSSRPRGSQLACGYGLVRSSPNLRAIIPRSRRGPWSSVSKTSASLRVIKAQEDRIDAAVAIQFKDRMRELTDTAPARPAARSLPRRVSRFVRSRRRRRRVQAGRAGSPARAGRADADGGKGVQAHPDGQRVHDPRQRGRRDRIARQCRLGPTPSWEMRTNTGVGGPHRVRLCCTFCFRAMRLRSGAR